MKKEVTVKAKSVEEALTLAAEQLGAPEAEVKYTVIAEAKRGFLGLGSSDAEISAYYIPRGEQAAIDFINTVIADMQLEAQVETRDGKDGELLIEVSGEGSGILIGHHGDTLDALQYLLNLAANRREEGEKREYLKVTLDIEGYRAKREETLRALARKQADKVLKYKRSVMLEPMNPYERRIIHSEVQNIKGVSTNSIGSENNRKIVIYLDNSADAE
ncbi:MAG: protein jag [Clostridia bacterium]|jgi:spoIIIJ-associated protein|nr:protein jag [Clostridia bacterium]